MKAVGEGGAAFQQAIKRRRVNLAVVQGVDGPKALVIGHHDQKIGLSGPRRRREAARTAPRALNSAGARSVEAGKPPTVFKKVRRSIVDGLALRATFNPSALTLPGTAATLQVPSTNIKPFLFFSNCQFLPGANAQSNAAIFPGDFFGVG